MKAIGEAGVRTRVYVWKHVMLLQANSRRIDPTERASRRLSATLIVALKNSVKLGLNEQPPREFSAVLLAPDIRRNSFEAEGAAFTLVDIDIASEHYAALSSRLTVGELTELSAVETSQLQALLAPSHLDEMTCTEIRTLFDQLIRIIEGKPPARDPRVAKTIQFVEDTAFNQFSIANASNAVNLSESRLSHLFKTQMGCTLSRYARWANVRKVLDIWRPGMPFAEAVTRAGFYDYAHFNRAASEQLLLSPTALLDGGATRIHRCTDTRTI